ncbi:MAG TPA: ABC transporter substrate-binding protein, partial [Myxococcaceae bacterium]|nr:ABC transporter substrate-binding protein [Myxococcaceae bacterium]
MGYRWKWLWTGAASLSLLTGCGEDAPSIPGEPEVKTFPLVVGWSGNSLRDFDPQFAFESGSIELVNNISASLLKANLTNGLPEADLATELPEVSQDGRTYTFKLRSGIKFADGTDLTADHFVRSFARTQLDADDVLAPTSGGTLVRPYVQSVDALDPLTVRYTLVEPTSRFTSIALTTAYLPSNARFPSDALFLSPRANLPSLPFVKDALSVTDPDQLLGSG